MGNKVSSAQPERDGLKDAASSESAPTKQPTRTPKVHYRRDGTCPRCGVQPKRAGQGYCRDCFNKLQRERRIIRAEAAGRVYHAQDKPHRMDGICPHCNEKPKAKGRGYCRDCSNEMDRNRRRRKAEAAGRVYIPRPQHRQ